MKREFKELSWFEIMMPVIGLFVFYLLVIPWVTGVYIILGKIF